MRALADVDGLSSVHCLVKLLDGAGDSVAQAVLAVHPPGHADTGTADSNVVPSLHPCPFSAELTFEGRLVGMLAGDAVVNWR